MPLSSTDRYIYIYDNDPNNNDVFRKKYFWNYSYRWISPIPSTYISCYYSPRPRPSKRIHWLYLLANSSISIDYISFFPSYFFCQPRNHGYKPLDKYHIVEDEQIISLPASWSIHQPITALNLSISSWISFASSRSWMIFTSMRFVDPPLAL